MTTIFRVCLLFLTPLIFSTLDTANAWEPTKPIEFIIPAGTGGGADQMARLISGASINSAKSMGGGGVDCVSLVSGGVMGSVDRDSCATPPVAATLRLALRCAGLSLVVTRTLSLPGTHH